MVAVNIYLTFLGNCLEAFEFYKSAFGGEFVNLSKFGEMPPSEGAPALPESEKNLIMHVSLPISKETVLMGSDNSEVFGMGELTMGNNFSASISVDTKKEGDRLFNQLSDGGEVKMPIEEVFWGGYFGQFTDKFGVNWMVSVEK